MPHPIAEIPDPYAMGPIVFDRDPSSLHVVASRRRCRFGPLRVVPRLQHLRRPVLLDRLRREGRDLEGEDGRASAVKQLQITITEASTFHDSSILLTEDGKRIGTFTDMHEGDFAEAVGKTLTRALLMVARQAAKEEVERG